MNKKWWTLLAVSMGMFMLLLDVTIVIVAQPAIQSALHAGLSDVQWVIDAYALTLAAMLLTAGVLADRLGRKLLFQIGLVVFTLGYSHPIEFPLPTGISVEIDSKQTHLTISGIDRQKVGQVAADMRSLRKPDPYKNKGVRYTGEKLKKKVGKTGAK